MAATLSGLDIHIHSVTVAYDCPDRRPNPGDELPTFETSGKIGQSENREKANDAGNEPLTDDRHH
jgi:hypothetical protein